MSGQRRYPEELRERAIRIVLDRGEDNGSQWSAIRSIADKFGMSPE